jgi:hypothetical protein
MLLLLGLLILVLGVVFTWMAAARWTDPTGASQRSGPALPEHASGPALVAVFCYFAAVVLFAKSRRLFTLRRLVGQTTKPDSYNEPVVRSDSGE